MANFNEELGIRYGVISPHSISSWSLDTIYNEGTDPYYEMGKDQLLQDLKEFCESHNINYDHLNTDTFIDVYNDSYESDGSGIMDYSDKEYDLHVSGGNFGIFVMKSPYYTYCRGCSPCAPGAGNLDSSFDPDDHEITEGYHRALCLGPEWFDKEESEYSKKIPYRVFRVDNDQEVI
jgi:hypothetical protein